MDDFILVCENESVMQKLLEIATKITKMPGLIFIVSTCKNLVSNRERNFILQELEGFASCEYLGTVFPKNDIKSKKLWGSTLEKSHKAAGAIVSMMKSGFNSYGINRTLYTSQVRPLLIDQFQELPYNPFDFLRFVRISTRNRLVSAEIPWMLSVGCIWKAQQALYDRGDRYSRI